MIGLRNFRLYAVLLAAALDAGCASAPTPNRLTLRCRAVDNQYFGFFSLEHGELDIPPEPGEVDLVYYFDGDDCRQGALIGHDDKPGYLFPIGHKTWRELEGMEMEPPGDAVHSVAAIAPLTRDIEGLAFRLKTANGEWRLARIATLTPATYEGLAKKNTARVVLEWR